MLKGYYGFWFDADFREILLTKTKDIPTIEDILIAYNSKERANNDSKGD